MRKSFQAFNEEWKVSLLRGDGQIDLNEYLASAEARFSRMDLNEDGYLTQDEHREYAKQMRAKHKEMRKQWREQNQESAPESE